MAPAAADAATPAEEPLFTMKPLPPVALPPFRPEGLALDPPPLPRGDRPASAPPPSAAEVEDALVALRRKFDDAVVFGLNVAGEKSALANDLRQARADLDAGAAAAAAPGAAAVADFEAAFDGARAPGTYNLVQVIVVCVLSFLAGAASHKVPALVWDLLDAATDGDRMDTE